MGYQPLAVSQASNAVSFEAYCLQGILKSENIAQHFDPSPSKPHLAAWVPVQAASSEAPIPLPYPLQQPRISTISETPQQSGGISNPSGDAAHFIHLIAPYAMEAARVIGLDPKLLIAQAALETGWGRSIARNAAGSSNNVFNIKAQAGDAVSVQTTEYIDGSPVRIHASFKQYPSIADSFADYTALIQESPRYQTARSYAYDPARYLEALQQAGYASDPDYAQKILSIYHGHVLNNTQYDANIL